MILGRVQGSVHATQKNPHLVGARLLLVVPVGLDGELHGAPLVCLDRVDAGEGDLVLVNREGGGARIVLADEGTPVKALIVAVVDRVDLSS